MRESSGISKLSDKKNIRIALKNQLLAITDRSIKDKQILSSLREILAGKINILSYSPDRFEVDVTPLAREYPDKTFYYPKIMKKNEMVFMHPDSWETGPYGIRQPLMGQKITSEFADLCIIPALGYNANGYRIGRGAGFYDRHLAHIQSEKIVGLTYEEVFPALFMEDNHDIFAGIVVTEKRIRHFPHL